MATMPNGTTTGSGDVQEHDEEIDSDLLCELYELLCRHGVDEGLRDTIIDMIGQWEIEEAHEPNI